MNNEIKKVEQRLEKAIKSKDSVLEQASLHLLSSGGKRVRPAFVILSSQFGKDEQTSKQVSSCSRIRVNSYGNTCS